MSTVDSDPLAWLHSWYSEQCDGAWEHTAGLRLDRLEPRGRRGPGWRLTVELAGTRDWVRAGEPARTLSLFSVDGTWLRCTLCADRFLGSGDAERLEEIVAVFRSWIMGDGELRADEVLSVRLPLIVL